MKKVYVINGKFMSDRMQGIVRYGREILYELDKVLDNTICVYLAIPSKAYEVPEYNNIKVLRVGKRNGIAWEQIDLAKFMRMNSEYTLINFCNVTPLFVQPGITVVHDIMYKTFPQNYGTIRNKLSRLWHCFQYKYIFQHEKRIVTVSEFSKNEIENMYSIAKGKISVIPNGWQHVLKYKENKEWQNKYPFLKPNDFFFSLSTLSINKNGKWIIEVAKNNPNCVFAMGGKIYETDYVNIPPNVFLLGFVSDEDACSLMKNCKAFIFPSLYEGFGIPPLEALALGAKVIVSDVTSLPEVLGESAYYINPYDYNVDLFEMLKTEKNNNALQRYSWNKSAKDWLRLLKIDN